MAYADYEYYKETYLGRLIPGDAFPRAIKKASQYIDYFTFGRITKENASDYGTLSDCACDMAEAVYIMTGNSGNGREKKSESIDVYSVSYVTENTDGNSLEDALRRKLYSIAKVYLLNTGLLSLEC